MQIAENSTARCFDYASQCVTEWESVTWEQHYAMLYVLSIKMIKQVELQKLKLL